MPLIGAGDQGWPAEQMLQTILQAAVSWMERGLPLRLLKIVIYREDVARRMAQVFTSYMSEHQKAAGQTGYSRAYGCGQSFYDLFLSYSHEEAEVASFIVDKLRESSGSTLMIFHDRTSLREGSTWLMKIADALDASHRIAALYSPAYWTSKNCQMEFLAAFTRQLDTGEEILFPIYLSDEQCFMFKNYKLRLPRERPGETSRRVLSTCVGPESPSITEKARSSSVIPGSSCGLHRRHTTSPDRTAARRPAMTQFGIPAPPTSANAPPPR